MPAVTDHPCFIQPTDQSALVWRYMDFTKYFSLVSTKSLFLCRADLLGDPFEGSYSKANIRRRPEIYKDMIEKDMTEVKLVRILQQISNLQKWLRQWTYINCWHMSEYESAAMWKLYAKSSEAVAIQATYKNLIDSLPDNFYVGLVQYIDYENDWLPEGNTFYPFLHKRKSFTHEREVRVVHQEDVPTSENRVELDATNDREGVSFIVDLNLLIEKVYVAPTSPDWYFNLVEEVLKKYGITKTVYTSKLDEEPVY